MEIFLEKPADLKGKVKLGKVPDFAECEAAEKEPRLAALSWGGHAQE
jgi:hypothetical protein